MILNMSLIKKLKSYFSFPKIKTVQLSNGKWIGKFKKSFFSSWWAADKNGTTEWREPVHVEEWCLCVDEEQAAYAAFSRTKTTLKDEIKKAMK